MTSSWWQHLWIISYKFLVKIASTLTHTVYPVTQTAEYKGLVFIPVFGLFKLLQIPWLTDQVCATCWFLTLPKKGACRGFTCPPGISIVVLLFVLLTHHKHDWQLHVQGFICVCINQVFVADGELNSKLSFVSCHQIHWLCSIAVTKHQAGTTWGIEGFLVCFFVCLFGSRLQRDFISSWQRRVYCCGRNMRQNKCSYDDWSASGEISKQAGTKSETSLQGPSLLKAPQPWK